MASDTPHTGPLHKRVIHSSCLWRTSLWTGQAETTETPAAAAAPSPQVISVASGAAGVSFVNLGDEDRPRSRYTPGVVTRPFTSEPMAASPEGSSAWVARSSSDASVAFLASAVALA